MSDLQGNSYWHNCRNRSEGKHWIAALVSPDHDRLNNNNYYYYPGHSAPVKYLDKSGGYLHQPLSNSMSRRGLFNTTHGSSQRAQMPSSASSASSLNLSTNAVADELLPLSSRLPAWVPQVLSISRLCQLYQPPWLFLMCWIYKSYTRWNITY